MDTFEEQLLQLGTKKRSKELHDLVVSIDNKQLEEFVERKVNSSNFSEIWDFLLTSFFDTTNCHKKRFKIIKHVLKKVQNNEISNSRCNAIIKRVLIEISKFNSSHLIKIIDWCIQSIQSKDMSSNCWKDLLPDVLNLIVSRNKIEYDDNDITGIEYKTQVINSLCAIPWHFGNVASLASMFKDITLNKEEHCQVVNKLSKCIDGLTPQEVPPVAYQLLCLCESQNVKQVFFYLHRYFSIRLYNSLFTNEQANEVEFDLEAISSASDNEIKQAESTIIYHVYQIASLGNTSIKEYLNVLKTISKCPSYIIHPFQIIILLSLSCIPHLETPVLELLKYSISRSISEQQKKKDSLWFQEMTTNEVNVKVVLEKILNNCIKERDLVVQGLVKLAFFLLSTGTLLGREFCMKKEWYFGQLIIVKLVKRQKNITPLVLNMLHDRIITEQSVTQYTECLNQLCLTVPLIMLENQIILLQMIEQLSQVPKSVGILLVISLLPLLKISYAIRDSLILILRKSLFSRESNIRQMAVSGFLSLLKYLKVNDLVALSQSSEPSSSSQSLLTQISVDCHIHQSTSTTLSNEVLCLEIINVLRRCFMLQCEVKAHLYSGLYDAVCVNPELKTHILDILLIHFKKFYVEDEEILPPLKFCSIVVIKDTNAILLEPLGKLMLTIGMIVANSNANKGVSIKSLTCFTEILDSLITRLTKCELLHFELDDGTDIMDIMPDSQKKQIQLTQILSVYEAILGYIIFSWTRESENYAQKLSSVFKAYSRLLEFAKNLGKIKKVGTGGSKKKNDDSFKKPAPVKNQFKLPPSVLNVEIVLKCIQLLYFENIQWATKIQANLLKTKREFHHYVLHTTLELVQDVKSMKVSEIKYLPHIYDNCTNIAYVLYNNCILKLNDLIDFDLNCALTSLEIFQKLLTVMFGQLRNKLDAFFQKIVPNCASLPDQIFSMIKVFQNLLEKNNEETDDEQKLNKISLINISIISTLSAELPPSHSEQVLDWCNKLIHEHDTIDKTLTVPLINLVFTLHVQCKTNIKIRDKNKSVFENTALYLSKLFGTIDHDEIPNSVPLKIINEDTMIPVLQALCNHLKSQLDDVDWIIMNLRAEFSMINYPETINLERKKELLKEKELDVCCHLYQITEVTVIISSIALPAEVNSEIIIKYLSHLYNTLSSLTKYFILRSSKGNLIFQHTNFENLVKLAGKQLLKNVYNLILFLEESQQSNEKNTQTKKKGTISSTLKKSKVLKETRFIPKLIYEIEQFGKFIIHLSNKTKEDLTRFMRQGTSRDFRIRTPILKNALENLNNVTSEISEDVIEEIENVTEDNSDEEIISANDNLSTTSVDDNLDTNEIENDDENSNNSNDPDVEPPRKKFKLFSKKN